MEIVRKPTGNRQEIDRKSRWGTAFGVLRVPDEATPPEIVECIEPFANFAREL